MEVSDRATLSNRISETNQCVRRHVYLDLQPYVCLDMSCPYSHKAFENREKWVSHLALDHEMEPRWKSITCLLCKEHTGDGKLAVTRHLSKHLEEISLSALPSGVDSDIGSEEHSGKGHTTSESSESIDKDKTISAPNHSNLETTEFVLTPYPPSNTPDTRQELIVPSSSYTPAILQENQSHSTKVLISSTATEILASMGSRVEVSSGMPKDRELAAKKAKLELFKGQAAKIALAEIQKKIDADTEEAITRRLEILRAAQKEAQREIEMARTTAERAARERLEAERKAEEERRRLHDQAMKRAGLDARLKLEAEFKAIEERKKAEAEAAAAAEEAAKIRIEAAMRLEAEAKAAAEKKVAEEIEWRKKLEAEFKLKAEIVALEMLEEEVQDKIDIKAKEKGAAHGPTKAPIRFKDATGRNFNFPFHLCQTWPVRYLSHS